MENKSTVLNFMKERGRIIKTTPSNGIFPPVICKDGLFISVQASMFHYCEPKETIDNVTDYESLEIRLDPDELTETEMDLISIFEGHEKCEYFYVPVAVVDIIISNHGGIDNDAVDKYIKENERRF